MKVLEINKFHYIKGGADRHYLEVIKLLKSKGNEVAAFSMEASPRGPVNDPSPWRNYFLSYVGYGAQDSSWEKIKGTIRMFFSFEARRKIKKLMDDFRPDVAHIHNIYHQLSPRILFQIKKRGIPIIMTVHDYKIVNPNYNLSLHGRFYDRCRNGRYYECLQDRCVKGSYLKSFLAMLEAYWHEILGTYRKNIDLYLAPSQFVKNILTQNGISPEKIKVFPHFAEKDVLATGVKKPKGRKKPYALYSGRISKQKGVDALIKIFKDLPEVELHLAGQIEDSLVMPKSDNIKYLGFLDQLELAQAIRESAFIVSASQLPETFGLIALEGMIRGKPFVGYNAGAYGEIVENDKTGYLCESETELREKVKKMADDEGLRILFSRNSLESARKYDSDRYYSELYRIFETLSDTKRKSYPLDFSREA